ncbi:hypothetical protein AMJ87_02370 [candidate division WOR_3 bacterium SM23_60]|uniref:Uncharacterized protein n=1 Tax=candidate division WOR_3 bacterium SM23_60 TaxID=1703780 RepID=A0A0S8GL65_UNCW3|nr:MAG: hypothetical protein AMJ87_02370 [candidate division WOR_3 bacterium SM23_60]
MHNVDKEKVEIRLCRLRVGQAKQYVVRIENSQTPLMTRKQALDYIRDFFTYNDKYEIWLMVEPPCQLSEFEIDYATHGMLDRYGTWEIKDKDETKIREGPSGTATHPAMDIIPSDAELLPFSTSGYAFYLHKHEGKVTFYIRTLSYHPGVLAIPLEKLEEMIKYLKKE